MAHGPLWRFLHRPRTKRARQQYRNSTHTRRGRDAAFGIRPGQRGGARHTSSGWGSVGWLVLIALLAFIVLYARRHTG